MNDVTIAPEQEIESGRRKIEWARAHMPILAGIKSRFEQELPFKEPPHRDLPAC